MKLNILPSKGGGIMFPAFDYNHEKDEYRNGYDNGQGDKGYDDGENEFASNLDESDVMRPVNSLDDYTSFLLWGTDFDDKNNTKNSINNLLIFERLID